MGRWTQGHPPAAMDHRGPAHSADDSAEGAAGDIGSSFRARLEADGFSVAGGADSFVAAVFEAMLGSVLDETIRPQQRRSKRPRSAEQEATEPDSDGRGSRPAPAAAAAAPRGEAAAPVLLRSEQLRRAISAASDARPASAQQQAASACPPAGLSAVLCLEPLDVAAQSRLADVALSLRDALRRTGAHATALDLRPAAKADVDRLLHGKPGQGSGKEEALVAAASRAGEAIALAAQLTASSGAERSFAVAIPGPIEPVAAAGALAWAGVVDETAVSRCSVAFRSSARLGPLLGCESSDCNPVSVFVYQAASAPPADAFTTAKEARLAEAVLEHLRTGRAWLLLRLPESGTPRSQQLAAIADVATMVVAGAPWQRVPMRCRSSGGRVEVSLSSLRRCTPEGQAARRAFLDQLHAVQRARAASCVVLVDE